MIIEESYGGKFKIKKPNIEIGVITVDKGVTYFHPPKGKKRVVINTDKVPVVMGDVVEAEHNLDKEVRVLKIFNSVKPTV